MTTIFLMHPLRKQLNRNPVIKFLSSVKITVACLVLLFILTFWGTIDQVYNGLYLAQARFFNSWAFTFWGFVPFPGAQLVLWVLFINLSCVALTRLVYQWSKIGIIIIHVGLLTFFVAAFITFHGVRESHIALMEGEAANVSQAYHNWELAVWTQAGHQKKVIAYDADHLKPGQKLDFERTGLSLMVESYYKNCDAYGAVPGQGDVLLNSSGIGLIKPKPYDKELEKNTPGGIFRLEGADQGVVDILLYGGERDPLLIDRGEETYRVLLRRKRFVLPFILKLKDFMMERHPNTEIARSYQSLVDVICGGASREVMISMNNPLRHKQYTLYQASYSIDNFGRERSTLAVVENAGRLLPYIATFITFAGLAVHLLMMAFESKFRLKRKKS